MVLGDEVKAIIDNVNTDQKYDRQRMYHLRSLVRMEADKLPNGREKSIAITKLDEFRLWAAEAEE